MRSASAQIWPLDALSVTSPLVTKALLQFLVDSYLSHQYPAQYARPPLRTGIGLAFGLFAMQRACVYLPIRSEANSFICFLGFGFTEGASIAHNHALSNTMTVGLLIRSTVGTTGLALPSF